MLCLNMCQKRGKKNEGIPLFMDMKVVGVTVQEARSRVTLRGTAQRTLGLMNTEQLETQWILPVP